MFITESLLNVNLYLKCFHFKCSIEHQIVDINNQDLLKYSPFGSLIENRKFGRFQLDSSSGSALMAILRIFPTEFGDKM